MKIITLSFIILFCCTAHALDWAGKWTVANPTNSACCYPADPVIIFQNGTQVTLAWIWESSSTCSSAGVAGSPLVYAGDVGTTNTLPISFIIGGLTANGTLTNLGDIATFSSNNTCSIIITKDTKDTTAPETTTPIIPPTTPFFTTYSPSHFNLSEPNNLNGDDPNSDRNNDTFMNTVNFGQIYVIGQGIQSSYLNDREYNFKVDNIFQELFENTTNYNFTLKDQDPNHEYLNITFVIAYQDQTNSREILSFSYEYFVSSVHDNYLRIDWNKETENYTLSGLSNSVLNLTEYLDENVYSEDSVEEAVTSPIKQKALVLGSKKVVEEGKSNGWLVEDASYELVKIYSLYSFEWLHLEDLPYSEFRYEIGLENGIGGTARVNFAVFLNGTTNEMELRNYGFRIVENLE